MRLRAAIAVAVGTAAGALLPPDALKGDPSRLIVSALSLMSAGIIPSITLTINSMKGGRFSVQRVNSLHGQLKSLVAFYVGLLTAALLGIVVVVVGEMFKWGGDLPWPEYTGRVFNILIGCILAFCAAMFPQFVRGLLALLSLQAEIAVDEADERLRERAEKALKQEETFATKPGFGRERGVAKRAED